MNQKRIKAIKYLKEKGMTRKEICQELKISHTMYSYYTNEDYRKRTIKRISEYNKIHKRKPTDKYKEYQRNYHRERYQNDSEYRNRKIERAKRK